MNPRPIGVFDSGVGGLTVFKALERALPRESLVYLGDTARVPYGPKSAETVVRYSLEASRFLRGHDVKLLVVACNSASSVAMDALRHEVSIPVLGVIGPGARRAVRQTQSGRIGVIGTRGTIGSGAYQTAIHELRPNAEVVCQPCPLFVPLAEEGWTDNDVAERVARTYLEPMMAADIDTLVLGCTHYPLLREVIGKVMGERVQLVDSAEAVSEEVRERLARDRELAASDGPHEVEHHYYVTDAPDPFQAVAERFLGRTIGRLERTRIEFEPQKEPATDGTA
jgi:glutamate racemase